MSGAARRKPESSYDGKGYGQKWQTGYRDSNQAFLLRVVIPAKAGIQAFGELSGSAELTEDRAVVDSRHSRLRGNAHF